MVVIIDPQNAGISGNMVLGALLDLGAHLNETKEIMEYSASLLGEVEVKISSINKAGIKSTYVQVDAKDTKPIYYNEFKKKLDNINHDLLDEQVIDFAREVFHRIAVGESQAHGTSLDNTHFHEVGAADALADVVGASFAYHQLKLHHEKIYSLPVALGGGTIQGAHGRMPIPAPATLNILKGALTMGGPVHSELTTPTGASILMSMKDEFKTFHPVFSPSEVGYGAGTMDLDFPNVLRIIRGSLPVEQDKISLLETNLDHLSGEVMGHLFEILKNEGALDVSIIPSIMKKNRPGQLLRVICKSKDSNKVTESIFKETGTLGVRTFPLIHRSVLQRKIIPLEVNIDGRHQMNFKVGMRDSKIITARVEYEDARRISAKTGIPLNDVMVQANEAFKKQFDNDK